MQAGSIYQETGSFNGQKYLLYLPAGIIVSSLLGIGYGIASHWNPYIFLNFVFLMIAIALSMAINKALLVLAECRNKRYTQFFIFIGAVFLLYNSWAGTIGMERLTSGVWDGFLFKLSFTEIMSFATSQNYSIGRFSSGIPLNETVMFIFYIVEALIIVVLPMYLQTKLKDYYCEDCNKAFKQKAFYFVEENAENLKGLHKGSLTELEHDKLLVANQMKSLKPGLNLLEITVNVCPGCSAAIADIETGKTKDGGKNEVVFEKDKDVISGLYLNKESREIILPGLV